MVKILLVVCASALFFQAIAAQCVGYNNAVNTASNIYGGCGCGYGAIATPIAANGGNLGINAASAINAPAGLTIVSENYIEGLLDVIGSLPIIASVAVEGSLPSTGSASTSYSCGDGTVGISADTLAAAGLGSYGSNNYNSNIGVNYANGNIANVGINYANANIGCNNGANIGGNYAIANLGAVNDIAALNGARIVSSGCGCY